MKKIIWLVIFTPFILAAQKPVVKIKSGAISGIEKNGVVIFKGIPFAQPPVGDLRWKAPQPVKPWKNIKECTAFGASPMQPSPVPFMCWSSEYLIPKEPIDEDCLYLNVWAPKKTVKKKAVLVYIYGGGFRSGGAGCPIYDGEAVANKDVVFVSINYRVGVFGFLAHPELSKEAPYHSSGNYGLLDMVAALQWVRDNIESFGGDPNKVTIAGQSAGAFAVNFLCASPLTKGLIHGAIAESGGSILTSSIRPNIQLKQAEELGVAFAKNLACSSIQALRSKSAQEILATNGGLSAPFEDGYFLPKSIFSIYEKDEQNDVPLLLGWNEDDKIMGKPAPAKEYIASIQKQFGAKAEAVLSLYPGNTEEAAAQSQGDMSRDQAFGVQGFTWANMQSAIGKSPVYVYNFNRKLPSSSPETDFGAFHTAEVAFAYDNLFTVNRPWEKADYALAKSMSTYWTNFVKTGNPNDASLVKWPVYNIRTMQVLQLDKKIESVKLPTQKKLELLSTLN
jgi:para-nitrobenzyl esterase